MENGIKHSLQNSILPNINKTKLSKSAFKLNKRMYKIRRFYFIFIEV